MPLDSYNVIPANPPFSGRLDRDRIVDDVKIGASTATELPLGKYIGIIPWTQVADIQKLAPRVEHAGAKVFAFTLKTE